MNLLRAEMFLRDYGAGNTKLAELYDEDEMLRSALATLFPGFEYPDFSYRTFDELRRKYFANPLPLISPPESGAGT